MADRVPEERQAKPTEPAPVTQRTFWKTLPGILTTATTLVAAVGGLIGGLAAAGLIGGSQTQAKQPQNRPPPITVRIEQVGGSNRQQGFFARDGSIITTLDPGNALDWPKLRAFWTEHGKEQSSAVEKVPGASEGWAVQLRLVDRNGPIVDWGVGSAADLRPGAPVVELGVAGGIQGHVRRTGVDVPYGGQTIQNLLAISRISAVGEGGSPLVDGSGNVVAMIVGETARETYALPIETIRDAFPNAF